MPVAIDLVGLDGDDTLWHNEAYFRLSEARFAALLAPWTDADADQLAARLLSVERANMDHYGYGAKASLSTRTPKPLLLRRAVRFPSRKRPGGGAATRRWGAQTCACSHQ